MIDRATETVMFFWTIIPIGIVGIIMCIFIWYGVRHEQKVMESRHDWEQQ